MPPEISWWTQANWGEKRQVSSYLSLALPVGCLKMVSQRLALKTPFLATFCLAMESSFTSSILDRGLEGRDTWNANTLGFCLVLFLNNICLLIGCYSRALNNTFKKEHFVLLLWSPDWYSGGPVLTFHWKTDGEGGDGGNPLLWSKWPQCPSVF